jgi:hypothetical protein
MSAPLSFPAKFRGTCPWCRSVILPSYSTGHGHLVAWMRVNPNDVGLQVVHDKCAEDIRTQRKESA